MGCHSHGSGVNVLLFQNTKGPRHGEKWMKSNTWRRERKRREKVTVNNGQLRLRRPPVVTHANCHDKFLRRFDHDDN